MTDPFDLDNLRLDPAALPQRRAVTPRKLAKRRKHFVQFPLAWADKLSGCRRAQTWHVAIRLLYLNWKAKGAPIKIANGTLEIDGITRWTKWRALAELEHLGLVTVERRPKKSPLVRVSLE